MNMNYKIITNENDHECKIKIPHRCNKISLWHILLYLGLSFSIFMILLFGVAFIWRKHIQNDDYDTQKLSAAAARYKNFVASVIHDKNLIEDDIQKFSERFSSTDQYEREEPEPYINKEKEDQKYPKIASVDQCDVVPINSRFDCLPDEIKSQSYCEKRGCCWRELLENEIPPKKSVFTNLHPSYVKERKIYNRTDIPYCYYPSGYSLYNLSDFKSTVNGSEGTYRWHTYSGYPKDVNHLKLEIHYETCSRLRIRIYDEDNKRWETPLPPVPKRYPGCPGKKLYNVEVLSHFGHIVVRRSSSNVPLFDMREAAPLIFSDQFIQISTLLPSSYIYGLGQHLDGLLLDTQWTRRMLWNADLQPDPGLNLYGSHPFYMVMEHGGSSHGVFLLNSNAIETIIQPTPALTIRTIGGIVDMYVFLGPSPDEVMNQYTEVIGRPFLPPYWSLGYHQCRFGYKTLENTITVWKRTRDAGIPFDVQWNDIDYMENRNDFTLSKAFEGLPEFVKELHELGMHYVIITDPGISGGEAPGQYIPYEMGLTDDVFIKNSTDQLFIGKVWNPNATVFPDFTRPNAVIYWNYLIRNFREQLEFDGLWIDMNEPSNFYNGQKDGCPLDSVLEHPYYIPPLYGGILSFKTLCMTAKQYLGLHYNVHNLYGYSEAITTYAALTMTPGITDPFIISRSTFPGIGAVAGHWTGDVHSDWFNMWKSIGDVLTMNIHAIPMVGADICGFNGNTTAALCNRWMQLGAFYPFSRNHNTDDGIDQDPVAMGEQVVNSSRKALQQRYTLLPFLYTLFVKAHLTGIPVAKPLFFKYPSDVETYGIDTQFMWGNELMIIPQLEEDKKTVMAYFPQGRWYNWYNGSAFSKEGQEYIEIETPLDTINLAVAGGSIIPCQNPGNTTTESRLNPFGLVVALNSDSVAVGDLHWNKPNSADHIYWKFRATVNLVISDTTLKLNGENNESLILQWIRIFGVSSKVHFVTVNGVDKNYTYSASKQVLNVENIMVNFMDPFVVYYK